MRTAKGIVSRAFASHDRFAGWSIVAGAAVAGLTALLHPLPVSPTEVTYVTHRGAPIHRELPDHSIIDQNAETETHARITPHARDLTLAGREAVIDIEPDPHLAMLIHAGDFIIQATSAIVWVKTASDGGAGEEDLTVGVLVGSVEVRCASGGITKVNLHAGDLAALGRNSVRVSADSLQEITRRTAWRRNQIWLAGETLGEAAGAFSRYNEHKILIPDRETASMRVGGRFFLGDIDKFVKALEPLQIGAVTLPRAPRSRDVIVLFGSKRSRAI